MNQSKPSKIFVDGQAGTTALQVFEFLENRHDIEVIRLPDSERKDAQSRKDAIRESDLTILCLPDDAAKQSAQWAEAAQTKVIDASTAHRVSDGWDYGLPEIDTDFRQAIERSAKVANPGCYPTGVILFLRPLIDEGVLADDCQLVIHALSGYSGGGRSLIEQWENPVEDLLSIPYSAPYALDRVHKHIPEMMKYSGLQQEPQFLPRVGPFFRGMRVEIPLHADWFVTSSGQLGENIYSALSECYRNETFVEVRQLESSTTDNRSFDPRRCNDTNRIELTVCAHPSGHVLLVAILDNLGKGASGAAVQCMNLMLGASENKGLIT